MKKILMFLSCILFFATTQIVKSQVTFPNGSKFTAIDDVTIEVDVTGTPLDGESAAYIWIFSNPNVSSSEEANFPKKDGIVNGTWGNSSEDAKMTRVSSNIYRFTFKAVDLFGLTPAQLNHFGFLVKTKTGSKQTVDFKPFTFESLIFAESVFRVFPALSGIDDVITFNFNQSLARDKNELSVDEQRMTVTSATVELISNTGAVMGTLANIPVRETKTGTYSATFIVKQIPNLPSNLANAKYFRYKFNGTTLNSAGATINVTGVSTQYEFSIIK